MNTLDTIKKIVAEYCKIDPKDVWNNSNFNEDLGLDSLDSIELIMKIEEECGIELDDDSLEGIKTVEGLANAIDARKKKA